MEFNALTRTGTVMVESAGALCTFIPSAIKLHNNISYIYMRTSFNMSKIY
jgi:hypothetical protein